MTMLRVAATLSALAMLAGCGGGMTESEKVNKANDELGKKIAADWQAVPGVAAVRYEYRHSVSTQAIGLDAALKPETASDALVQELIEIVKRDYWQSATDLVFSAAIYRSNELPDGPTQDKSTIMFNGPIKIDMYDKAQVAELNAKYGPKPEKK
ncbi:hypothetical protein ABZX92_37525 [Lentzea sp. NPDC006480]|uniref:hypothetical protein n=1 Tax=Lentzea sp. NPDC006480 TaxID=3157176 RepID=UPI0033A4F7F2